MNRKITLLCFGDPLTGPPRSHDPQFERNWNKPYMNGGQSVALKPHVALKVHCAALERILIFSLHSFLQE